MILSLIVLKSYVVWDKILFLDHYNFNFNSFKDDTVRFWHSFVIIGNKINLSIFKQNATNVCNKMQQEVLQITDVVYLVKY